MTKTEFIQELNEALQGEVPAGVINENLRYYDNYITQETAEGRTEEDIMEELGGPRIIARTIIDSSDAAAETGQAGAGYSRNEQESSDPARSSMNSHYVNLNKWYWKLFFIAVILLVFLLIFTVVGGVFSLLFRFAGPLLIIWLVYSLFKGMRR